MYSQFNSHAGKPVQQDVRITKEMLHDVRQTPNEYLRPNGRTKLMQALLDGHDAFVHQIVDRDQVDYKKRDTEGQNLMHYAVMKKNKSLIKKLIKKGIALDSPDKTGKTPFSKLFEQEKPDLRFANWLLKKGADPDRADKRGRRALHHAAGHHGLNVVEFLLKVTKNVDKPDHVGVRPFHDAVEKNNASVVQAFSHHRVDLRATDNKSNSVFHLALENKDSRVMRFLLTTDAVKVLNHTDMDKKQTALHKAVLLQNLDAAQQMLEKGANLNAKDKNGMTPLALSVSEDSGDMVRSLLDKGADIVHEGCSALEESISYNNAKHFSVLMEYAPDVNLSGQDGKTALMRATQYGHMDIVETLLSAGSDPNVLSDEGKNVLFYIGHNTKPDMVQKLIDNGADVNQVDKYGRTPLLDSLMGSYDPDNIKILVKEGADLNFQDKSGQTPLHQTLRQYSPDVEMFKWLIEQGADPKKSDNEKSRMPLLHRAAEIDTYVEETHGERPIKILLDAGLDIEQRDEAGFTALAVAMRMYNKENVELLLEYGADLDARSNFGETPRQIADRHYNGEMKQVVKQFEMRKRIGLSPKFKKASDKGDAPKPPAQDDPKFKGPNNGLYGGFGR